MSVEITGLHDLISKLKTINFLLDDKDMSQAGELAKSRILKRTQRGVSANGSPFARYSTEYAKKRAKKGRKTNPVNLLFSGLMLKSMSVDSNRDSATIFFLDAKQARKAKRHTTGDGIVRRKFFALSQDDDDAIAKFLTNKLNRKLNKR